ncbi:hypothetical protein G6O69_28890 [Pseudenhygromyxa sp. WMMC2535]|uniref:hypothetical protein n=1 Tax=Pseudenhygromyxa sp. WMMC2535 TaxID=2712867 RepID=UPI0015571CD5|nr:hypothetical protein [Pseudenhygromyxa sp. WMMC2535]NVB41884.1 hypothetical protein [Pseudenhygromyxa sp. WMMC2535]
MSATTSRFDRPLSRACFALCLLGVAPGCNKAPADTATPLGTGSSTTAQRRAPGPRGTADADTGAGTRWRGSAEAPESAAPRSEEALGTGWGAGDFEADRIVEPERPGLGTAYGESRRSSIQSVGFRRADPLRPEVVFTIHYDDAAGVRAAARGRRTRAWSDEAMQSHEGLSFALLDERDRVLPAASVDTQLYAVGAPGARYSLAVANDTGSAFELVASVDGLDVIDGAPASFDKRGYVIDPFSSMVIEGWRTSEDAVAAFRFSSLEDSYAERTGEGRNVGVIGAALFREAPRAWEEWRAPDESWRRGTADPFPGN